MKTKVIRQFFLQKLSDNKGKMMQKLTKTCSNNRKRLAGTFDTDFVFSMLYIIYKVSTFYICQIIQPTYFPSERERADAHMQGSEFTLARMKTVH